MKHSVVTPPLDVTTVLFIKATTTLKIEDIGLYM